MASLEAYIGEPFVFQILYLDGTGAPFAPTSPNISVFRFDGTTGDKVAILTALAMSAAVPVEVGRYVYRWTVDPTLLDGMVLYTEYRAIDPLSGDTLFALDTIQVHAFEADDFLRARFV